MSLAVRDRPFDDDEIERLRLLLSTFRDGSGQFLGKLGIYMPDYLAFERATAFVCGGHTTENKGIFDVLVDAENWNEQPFGISCKMATAQPSGRSWFMELSNSAKKFHDAFAAHGVDWVRDPHAAGNILVDLVCGWHHAVEDSVDIERSKYLVLEHDAAWQLFRIASFNLDVLAGADPATEVRWCVEGRNGVPSSVAGYIDGPGGELRLWQFYANTGGQLKFYPPIDWAEWYTHAFPLEEPPVRGLRDKVDEYWPGAWPEERSPVSP